MPEHPIVVRELTKRFGDFTAVDAVSFDVREGEIFGFLGPNGAGKTTTIKMLIGLLEPTSGSAEVAGVRLGASSSSSSSSPADPSDPRRPPLRSGSSSTSPADVRDRIGYMSQRFSLYGDLTVGENIELFAGLYGVEGGRYEERRRWVLEMAGLEDRTGLLTAELPLGWKQRLALGCAVLHEPPILFLDEPTSGVDPLARRRFWDLIDGLAEAGTTVLVSTHYMEEAEYCHRLSLMNRGRLIALDTPRALRRSVDLPLYSVRADEPARAVAALQDEPGVLEAAMFGRSVHVMTEAPGPAVPDGGRPRDGSVPGPLTARPDPADAIRRRLAAAGLGAGEVARIEPSLEDVFVALVRREGGAREG